MGIVLAEIVIILLLSAFFSGMEIAFVSSNKLRFEMDKSNPSITTRILDIFYNHQSQFISTLLVGNNIALVVYGILMAQVIDYFILSPLHLTSHESLQLIVQTLLSTLIVLVTGEFLPKTLFKINPNKTMRVFAIPAFLFYVLLYPVSQLCSWLSKIIMWCFGLKVGKKEQEGAFTKVDLDYFIQSSLDNTTGTEDVNDEVKIFQNALDFSNVKVRDCMVPRTEIEAVDLHASLEELKSHFTESGKSKIVVFDGDIDHVVGYIHSSEMFHLGERWSDQIKQLPIVPETMSAHKLLKSLMQKKKSIAVIVDEFGGTSGIATIEDLVEEIFGDIEDEHDTSNYIAQKITANEYIISARLEIERINELLDLDLPESDEYQTLGGLILHAYQSFPKLNEVIIIDKYEFKILKNTMTKIELVRLKVHE